MGGFSTASLLTTRDRRIKGSRLGLTSGDATREAVPAAVPRAGADVLFLVGGAALEVHPYTEDSLLTRRLGRLLSNPTGDELLVEEEDLVLLRLGGKSTAVSAFRLLTFAGSDLPTTAAADPGPGS